jgi:1-acyl-sn-glycerol-3-phosphate acyltransferase
MVYTVVRFILFLLFKIFFNFRSFGRENFPKQGPVIIASNHASFFDPIIVGIGASRKLNYMARDTLFRNKIFARLLYSLNTLPLKRDGADINAFKMVLNKLLQGNAVLVFPEGTRSSNGDLQRPKAGIGFLEVNSSAPILPCYIKGSLDALPRHSIIPRFRPVSVYFGKALRFNENFKGNKRDRYMFIAEQVMSAIAELKKNAN